MAESLNYQPSHSAVYYTPPGRIDVMRTVAAALGAVIIAIVGAFAYAKIQPDLDSLIFRGVAVGAAAFATGALGMMVVHFGAIRIPVLAAFIGTILAMIVLYTMWVVWAHDVLVQMKFGVTYWAVIRHPIALYRFILTLSKVGTWALHGEMVKGASLVLFWLGEAGLILAGGVLMPIKAIDTDALVCRQCGKKCRSIGRLPRFAGEQRDQVVAAIQNRDFASLESFTAPQGSDDPELALSVVGCPCGQTRVLTLSYFAWTVNAQNIAKVMTTPLVKGLLITREEMDQIRRCTESIEKRWAAGEDIKKSIG